MRCEIDENGTLLVQPENSTEAWALKQWSINYPYPARRPGETAITILLYPPDGPIPLKINPEQEKQVEEKKP
jgi:hypothetical protein